MSLPSCSLYGLSFPAIFPINFQACSRKPYWRFFFCCISAPIELYSLILAWLHLPFTVLSYWICVQVHFPVSPQPPPRLCCERQTHKEGYFLATLSDSSRDGWFLCLYLLWCVEPHMLSRPLGLCYVRFPVIGTHSWLQKAEGSTLHHSPFSWLPTILRFPHSSMIWLAQNP